MRREGERLSASWRKYIDVVWVSRVEVVLLKGFEEMMTSRCAPRINKRAKMKAIVRQRSVEPVDLLQKALKVMSQLEVSVAFWNRPMGREDIS